MHELIARSFLVSEGVIANNAPDADALSACEELGKAIAG